MAAIDKLYVHSYYEYDDLRKWAIAYYPELLFYFYDITTTYQQWEANCRAYVKQQIAIAKRDYEKIDSSTLNPVSKLIVHYKKTANYDCPIEQAQEEVCAIIDAYHNTARDWEKKYSVPIMNTPFEVDRKLKWICPVPCVRKYLHEQCGVNPKWEGFYEWFWRGKKHFQLETYNWL